MQNLPPVFFIHVAYPINNAGIHGAGEAWAVESRDWERTLGVNLHGTFYLTRAFSQAMVEKKFGRIVNIASAYASIPGPVESPYAAAKAGVTGYARAVAHELAPHGITVKVIAPGVILRTPSGFNVEYGWGAREVDDSTWQVQMHTAGSIWGHQGNL